jgi:hypothetical protein
LTAEDFLSAINNNQSTLKFEPFGYREELEQKIQST